METSFFGCDQRALHTISLKDVTDSVGGALGFVGCELTAVGCAATAAAHARIEAHTIAEIAVAIVRALALIGDEPKVELIATTTATIAIERLALWCTAVLSTHGTRTRLDGSRVDAARHTAGLFLFVAAAAAAAAAAIVFVMTRGTHVVAKAEKRLAVRHWRMTARASVVVDTIAALTRARVTPAVHTIALVDGVLFEQVAFVGAHFGGRVRFRATTTLCYWRRRRRPMSRGVCRRWRFRRCASLMCRFRWLARLFVALTNECATFERALKALLVLADAVRIATRFSREAVARVGVGTRPHVVAAMFGVVGADAFVAETARAHRFVDVVRRAGAAPTPMWPFQVIRRCGRRR
jgi:hypothetical protein